MKLDLQELFQIGLLQLVEVESTSSGKVTTASKYEVTEEGKYSGLYEEDGEIRGVLNV